MKIYVITASEETELEKATDIMGYMQIRRLVVVNNENKIVGILSTTDLLSNPLTENLALDTLIEISYNFPTKCEETEGLLQTNVFIL